MKLIERLRSRRVLRWTHSTGETPQADGYLADADCFEAADEIEHLTAENEALRAALTSIAKNTCCDRCQEAALVARAAIRTARKS